MALNLNYSGCCDWSRTACVTNKNCHCDITCFQLNDCCSDIADIGCHPGSLSPTDSPSRTDTMGKTKSEPHAIP